MTEKSQLEAENMESGCRTSLCSKSSRKSLCLCKTLILDNVSKAIKHNKNEDGITFKNILGTIRSFFPLFTTKRQAEHEVKKVLRYGLNKGSIVEVNGKFVDARRKMKQGKTVEKGICRKCGGPKRNLRESVSMLLNTNKRRTKERACCRRRSKEEIENKKRYRRGWIRKTIPKQTKDTKNKQANKKRQSRRNKVTWKKQYSSKWVDRENISSDPYFTALTDLSRNSEIISTHNTICSEDDKTPVIGQQKDAEVVVADETKCLKGRNCTKKMVLNKTTSTVGLNLHKKNCKNTEKHKMNLRKRKTLKQTKPQQESE